MIKFFRKIRQNLLSEGKNGKYLKYAIGEIILVVIGILIALQINNWNIRRINSEIEKNILKEISNGLFNDLKDIDDNMEAHIVGLKACKFWKKIITNQPVEADSIIYYNFSLTQNFLVIQNTSSYESLKSKGLELISNDSLRLQIISLYEEQYQLIRKLEEEYMATQFFNNFNEINDIVSPYFLFDEKGNFFSIKLPVDLRENDYKKLLIYIDNIYDGRKFILWHYKKLKISIGKLQEVIDSTK